MNHEVFLLLVVGVLATGNPVPQSLRLGGGEVGASFGGYSASAGLGGLLGGGGASAGGLHAEAGTPNGPAAAAGLGGLLGGGGGGGGKLYSGATVGGGGPSAAAGLGGLLGGGGGGGKLYSGASTGGGGGFGGGYGGGYGGGNYIYGGGGPKGGFFDRIFDIPISTLNAVNRMLNEGGVRRTGAGVSKSRSSASSSSRSKVVGHGDHLRTITKTKSKSVSRQYAAPPQGGATFASASSSAGVQPGANYDRVFDIPRSVLSAVNRFLNEGR